MPCRSLYAANTSTDEESGVGRMSHSLSSYFGNRISFLEFRVVAPTFFTNGKIANVPVSHADVDVTDQVRVGRPDDEVIPLLRCICGRTYDTWAMMPSV